MRKVVYVVYVSTQLRMFLSSILVSFINTRRVVGFFFFFFFVSNNIHTSISFK